jgi:hypothetical protein
MSEPSRPGRRMGTGQRFRRLGRLPWRSGGAGALLIAIMSAFDDSAFDAELLSSSAESSADDSSDSGGRRPARRGQGVMLVKPDGQPDPNTLTDQDYHDIPGA